MAIPIAFLDSDDLRKEVLGGIDELARLVAVTLGPGGRTVLLEQADGKKPLSTKDGVTVAESYVGNTPVKRVVVSSAIEVCQRTARQAGDGTTTAIVLAAALVKEGQDYLSINTSLSPQQLARQLRDIFHKKVKTGILGLSKSIKSLPHNEALAAITHVAKVSSNHDQEIADAVSRATDLVGESGMVMAEEGTGSSTDVIHKEGFPANTGLRDLGGSADTAFVNGSSGDCKLEGAYVLLYDGEVRESEQLIPLMNEILSERDEKGQSLRTPLVIFAHGYANGVLAILAQNFRQGRFTAIPMITPRNGQSHYRQSFLHDLQAYVGGTVLDPQGRGLSSVTLQDLGFATDFKATQSETVIEASFNEADTARVQGRIQDLQDQIKAADNDFDKDRYRYRVGQLTGGVATILAGGPTSFEAKERHARVVDAVSAVRSAMEMGVVPGGGSALLYVASQLSLDGPEGIFKRALMVPFSQILRNAGAIHKDENGNESVVVAPGEKDGDIGPTLDGQKFLVFDALTMTYIDWWESGIMDPTKVSLTALENALSVAQLLMTLGGVVAFSSNEDEQRIQQMQNAMVRAMKQETD
jgi:chaperonin GroEL